MTVVTPFQVCIVVSRNHMFINAHTIFQTLFAVPMTCQGCINDVSEALYNLSGVSKVEANLNDQLVSIEGTGWQKHF